MKVKELIASLNHSSDGDEKFDQFIQIYIKDSEDYLVFSDPMPSSDISFKQYEDRDVCEQWLTYNSEYDELILNIEVI